MKLHEYPVIVVVWGLADCPACKEYMPRFRAVAERYEGCIPAATFDTETVDGYWIDRYSIVHVPCTMVLRYGQVTARRDRPIEDRTIEHLFYLAAIGAECEVERPG